MSENHFSRSGIFSAFSRFVPFFGRDPLVAADQVTDRSLVAVISILTFLAALTACAAQLTAATAMRWQVMMVSEVTVQLKPQAGRSIDTDIVRASDILRGTAGITSVKVLRREESAKLLEPWLGSASSIESLPIPRLIVVQIDTHQPPDLASVGKALADAVPGTSLDDHRTWTKRLGHLSNLFLIASFGALLLVVLTTGLTIVFATRGAMAGNREIIEVLHFIGADDRYIAGQFQSHFAVLGVRGGLLGGGAALLLVLTLKLSMMITDGLQFSGLSEVPILDWRTVFVTFCVIVLVGIVAGLASRITVYRTIGMLA